MLSSAKSDKRLHLDALGEKRIHYKNLLVLKFINLALDKTSHYHSEDVSRDGLQEKKLSD